MALPWLESLPVGADAASAVTATGIPIPKRFAALFMGNGISPETLVGQGHRRRHGAEQSPQPLAPFKTKLNVITGLFNKHATGVGIHPGQTGNILSGGRIQKGAVLHGGISMDQVLAGHFEEETAQPSMVLGCEQPITGYHETNFSMAYSSHISWQNANSPVPMEVYPSLAFDSLFDNQGSRRNLSILDRVQEQAPAPSAGKSAHADKAKLDEYLTSVREVEKRSRSARDATKRHGRGAAPATAGRPMFTMPRPANGLPEDIREHMRLMCDIIALAFQTDKTRVATLLLCRDLSGLFYPFLDVRTAIIPPRTTINPTPTSASPLLRQPARLSRRAAGSDARRRITVLDNSCLHVHLATCGRAASTIQQSAGALGRRPRRHAQTGRVLDYLGRGDDNRKLCSLYLSLMDRMGVKARSIRRCRRRRWRDCKRNRHDEITVPTAESDNRGWHRHGRRVCVGIADERHRIEVYLPRRFGSCERPLVAAATPMRRDDVSGPPVGL